MTSRLIVLTAALAVSAAACGSKSTPDTPNGPTTSTVVFSAALLPANEVPAFNNAESTASGNATITFHVTKDDSGTITSTTVDFQATISGMPAGSTITMAHIHPGVAGVANGVLLGTGVASGDVPLTNGAGSFTKNGVTGLSAADAQAIINNPSAYYFNVHSVLNPPGFMRGQLTKVQ